MKNLTILITSLLALALLDPTHALEFVAANNAIGTPGGNRFDSEFGLEYTLQTMNSASEFIWRAFQQDEATRRPVSRITTTIENEDGVAYTSGDHIRVSAQYIANFNGDVRREIVGLLYHEVAHSWQYNGQGHAPSGLIEGVADYLRLTSGYAAPYWIKPGGGDRWDQGYDVTAYFLQYCEGLRQGFVADLNAKMKDGYNVGFFQDLVGKSVDQLWSDYKARYGN
ncbi:uncharacterized protein LOC18430360 [Amborella trichopoda]|uniref:Basic secretory protease n=1 Tax=Amborella trichopoda TaxID=13333 RepID=W1P5M3_AMBTC|nr:uncharacterized protein LOC18430360 [Amborella trichopoda]ERN02255.1 hypothetical protein AMTR_s00045p00230850 [Amborella trichopoda]|eukprot:XP_006840580.1 uncharacterized protein LOC18430360 [Amborella trichopoda]